MQPMQIFRQLRFYWLYQTHPRWDTGITPPELIEFIQQHPPGRALDLGCGTGTNAITLAQNGWTVTGIDFIRSAVHKAKSKTRQAGVTIDYVIQDVTQIDHLDRPYDLVLDIGCLHGLPPTQAIQYIRNLPDLLTNDGSYLLYALLAGSPQSKPGLTPEDIDLLNESLKPIWRKDGIDRPGKPSAWFCFNKHEQH
jgi:2-polyprenyl-3-methyl-5-hydroxy-6-metoxy-1,4-benzoquinol methylase